MTNVVLSAVPSAAQLPVEEQLSEVKNAAVPPGALTGALGPQTPPDSSTVTESVLLVGSEYEPRAEQSPGARQST
jgi:hypothetical protein